MTDHATEAADLRANDRADVAIRGGRLTTSVADELRAQVANLHRPASPDQEGDQRSTRRPAPAATYDPHSPTGTCAATAATSGTPTCKPHPTGSQNSTPRPPAGPAKPAAQDTRPQDANSHCRSTFGPPTTHPCSAST